MTKTRATVALSFCSWIALSGVVSAQKSDSYFGWESYGEVGPYLITKQSDPNSGEFDHCFAERRIASGIDLKIEVDQTNFARMIVLQRRTWHRAVVLSGSMTVDGREVPLDGSIAVEDGMSGFNNIVYPVGDAGEFLRRIASARDMILSFEKTKLKIPLVAMADAVRATAKCTETGS